MGLPTPLALDFSAVDMTEEQFARFCSNNAPLRFELTSKRKLIVMPPTFSGTGRLEGQLYFQLELWAREDGTGITFSPSAGFTLPNGAIRSPDASWVLMERWNQWEELLRAEGKEDGFGRFAPDFVIELRSTSDTLASQQAKMAEYIENGVRLGWLIDPRQRRVYVYRPGQSPEVLENPAAVSGEDVLPGFQLNVQQIW